MEESISTPEEGWSAVCERASCLLHIVTNVLPQNQPPYRFVITAGTVTERSFNKLALLSEFWKTKGQN